MLKKIILLLLVLVLMFSFSSLALANPGQGNGSGNGAEHAYEDGKLVKIHLPNETAKDAAGNPIDVAGR